MDDAFLTIFHKRPVYMRPPYGDANDDVSDLLTELGYKIITWNIDTDDWEHPDDVEKDMMAYNALSSKDALEKGWIGLEHDVNQDTAKDLAIKAIKFALELGFKVEPVGTCLGDSPSNWYRQ